VSWTPDGRQILYGSDEEGPGKAVLMFRDADGSGTPRRLEADSATFQAMLLTNLEDGLGLVYVSNGSLWLAHGSKDPKPQRLGGDLPLGWSTLSLSPDGHWLAYTSDVSDRTEVFVRPFPTGHGTWQISRGGGTMPYWSSRGGEVFFRRQSGDERWISSARIVTTQEQTTASAPTDLFKVPADADVWGPHPDGNRFILVRHLPPAFKGDRIEAVLNWSDEVKARTSGR
jgi:hypothetical protein